MIIIGVGTILAIFLVLVLSLVYILEVVICNMFVNVDVYCYFFVIVCQCNVIVSLIGCCYVDCQCECYWH